MIFRSIRDIIILTIQQAATSGKAANAVSILLNPFISFANDYKAAKAAAKAAKAAAASSGAAAAAAAPAASTAATAVKAGKAVS